MLNGANAIHFLFGTKISYEMGIICRIALWLHDRASRAGQESTTDKAGAIHEANVDTAVGLLPGKV